MRLLLGEARDQLWAEALHLYRAGESWHLGDADELSMSAEAEARLETDPWEESIAAWTATRVGHGERAERPFTMDDILRDALDLRTSNRNPKVTARVSRVLSRLGYERRRRATLPRGYHYVRVDVPPSHRPTCFDLTSPGPGAETESVSFASESATLLEARALALEAAVLAVETRRAGAAAQRKATQRGLLGALGQVRAYVQSFASGRPTVEATMVIRRAGLHVKDAQGPRRGVLKVKPGRVSGTARAYTKAVNSRASYEWQCAPDGGEWVSLAPTRRSETQITGLVPGALYRVRVRSLTGAGLSDWSDRVRFRGA